MQYRSLIANKIYALAYYFIYYKELIPWFELKKEILKFIRVDISKEVRLFYI
jgi:hypothetical protein